MRRHGSVTLRYPLRYAHWSAAPDTVARSLRKWQQRPTAPKLLPPFDRTLHRLTVGRFLVGRLLVPSLVLTTTGRRSGVPRDAPLTCISANGGR